MDFKRTYIVLTTLLFLQSCDPNAVVSTPVAPPSSSSTVDKVYTITVDIPQSTPTAGPIISGANFAKSNYAPTGNTLSRSANLAASFAIVDINPVTGKILKEFEIKSASQNGDATWAIIVESNPNAATVLIVHANDNAPTICINCALPDDSVYVPLTDFQIKADVLSTIALDHTIGMADPMTIQEMDEYIEGIQKLSGSLPILQSGQTLDEYLTSIATSYDAEVSSEMVASTQLPSKPINDTGVTLCGDYAYPDTTHNNKINCYDVGANKINSGAESTNGADPVPSGQDALYGRDVDPALNTDSDGFKGMSFTKLDVNGSPLAVQNGIYNESGNEIAGTKWSCVKDNVTGLVWEEKTNDGGLRDKDWTYSWYNTNALTNGGIAGTQNGGTCSGGSGCDTEKYIADVNAISLCGANNWHLPALKQLITLCIFDDRVSTAAIDTNYFPNYSPEYYWSSTVAYTENYPGYSNIVRYLSHSDCHTPGGARSFTNNVRLVH